ncbi:MAG TPA: O-antigen ligase family protein [Phycisphaerae bacterium]|nr:O-antigen ligase family protein [Phycisphaerae bacterium]HRY68767.1 O-antigen ligase family protein [Phycisphaerae bacterium]HSA28910.1 O-antigen ligase family protein [Phycisphaerae bacterium]
MSESPINNTGITENEPLLGAEGNRPGLTVAEQVLVVVAIVTLAACCLLISAGEGVEVGHKPWKPGSALRALTSLMVFNHQYPTRQGVEIKWLVQGVGTAIVVLVAATAWFGRSRREEGPSAEAGLARGLDSAALRRDIPSSDLAQVFLLLMAAWSILSYRWSPWPEVAWGEGLRQLGFVLWAIALGRTLTSRGVRYVALGLTAVLVVTAVIGIWYHIERAPAQRLKFPIGNPIFFAACLLPGIMMAVGGLVGAGLRLAGITRSGASSSGPSGSDSAATRLIWGLAVSGVVLIILSWAFYWADSRGPQMGLAVGLMIAGCCLATGRKRRILLVVMLVVLAILAAVWLSRRTDTAVFRLYCWSYALSLFMERPLIGHGQGSYVLLAQAFSRNEAELNPSLFPAEMLGHAHNEWLEILADLGLVGLILTALALAATCWAGMVALQRAKTGCERWTIFALLGSFVGIVACEATDVGLRMPGLPLIYWTVVGLLWAASRGVEDTTLPARRFGGLARVAGLGAGVVVCGATLAISARDWQGALADYAVTKHSSKMEWDPALKEAEIAASGRLSVEAKLSAANLANMTATQAAGYRWQQLQRMLVRQERPDRLPVGVLDLIREDVAAFGAYREKALANGEMLLTRMPGYPNAAGRMADVEMIQEQIEHLQEKLGLIEKAQSYLPRIRALLLAEFQRDRLDPVHGLRAFRACDDRSLTDRVDFLRLPLRSGPFWPASFEMGSPLGLDLIDGFNAAIESLMDDESLSLLLDRYVQAARTALQDSDPKACLETYIPESVRLAARTQMLNREFARAADLAGLAAALSQRIEPRFPTAVSLALIDQAEYLLLAFPNEPAKALESCQASIKRWPKTGGPDHTRAVNRNLAFYLLACGNEEQARRQLTSNREAKSEAELNYVVGLGYSELCQQMASLFPPKDRPTWFADAMEKSLRLAPDWPNTRLLATHVSLEIGDSLTAMNHLAEAEKALDDPARFQSALMALTQRFPDNPELQAFVKQRMPAEPTTPVPVVSRPASAPASMPNP